MCTQWASSGGQQCLSSGDAFEGFIAALEVLIPCGIEATDSCDGDIRSGVSGVWECRRIQGIGDDSGRKMSPVA